MSNFNDLITSVSFFYERFFIGPPPLSIVIHLTVISFFCSILRNLWLLIQLTPKTWNKIVDRNLFVYHFCLFILPASIRFF